MNQPSNVISLASRKPIEVEEAEALEAHKAEIEAKDNADQAARGYQIQALDDIRARLAAGDIDGFVLIGHSPKGCFLTEVAIPQTANAIVTMAYLGALEAIRLELADSAQMMPQMINDGSIIDPNEGIEFEDDGA